MIKKLLFTVFLVGALSQGFTGTAQAFPVPLPGDKCPNAPTAEIPKSRLTPQNSTPGPSQFEQRGLAGISFTEYDKGCSPFEVDLVAAFDKIGGTITMGAAKFLLNAVDTVAGLVDNSREIFGWADRPAQQIAKTTWAKFSTPGGILSIILFVTGCIVFLKWRHRNIGSMLRALAAIALALALGQATATDTSFFTRLWDDTTSAAARLGSSATTGTVASDPAAGFAGTIRDNILVPQWETATFGCTNCAAATKWSQRLITAASLTHAEAANVDNDPAAYTRLIEAKREDFRLIAEEIKTSDPVAYGHVQGKGSTGRTQAGLWSFLIVFLAAIPPFVTLAIILMFSFVIRFLLAFAPVLCMLAILPATRSMPLRAVQFAVNTIPTAFLMSVVASIGTVFISAAATGSAIWPIKVLSLMGAFIVSILALIWASFYSPFRRWGDSKKRQLIAQGKSFAGQTPSFVGGLARSAAGAVVAGTAGGIAAGAVSAATNATSGATPSVATDLGSTGRPTPGETSSNTALPSYTHFPEPFAMQTQGYEHFRTENGQTLFTPKPEEAPDLNAINHRIAAEQTVDDSGKTLYNIFSGAAEKTVDDSGKTFHNIFSGKAV